MRVFVFLYCIYNIHTFSWHNTSQGHCFCWKFLVEKFHLRAPKWNCLVTLFWTKRVGVHHGPPKRSCSNRPQLSIFFLQTPMFINFRQFWPWFLPQVPSPRIRSVWHQKVALALDISRPRFLEVQLRYAITVITPLSWDIIPITIAAYLFIVGTALPSWHLCPHRAYLSRLSTIEHACRTHV